ncbi:polyprenyl synthetase family protein [Tessaracoccus terricola]
MSPIAPTNRLVDVQPDPSNPLGPEFLDGISGATSDFLDSQADVVAEIGGTPMLDLAKTFTAGGKRLRPAFCYWSYVAAAGHPDDPRALLRASASLDLLHVSALVHDDLIDASDTRRGVPSAHRQFGARHLEAGGRGDAEQYGTAAAILLGDLLLVWSLELFENSGLPTDALARARTKLSAMRTEVTAGQFLDVSAAFGVTGARSTADELADARKILEYKTASYSVRRPAQAGAALGADDQHLQDALGEFGSALGAAFQLRDDVLGVYGDEAATGKPTGGDLREGKRTILVLTALDRGDATQRGRLEDLLGHEDLTDEQVSVAREIIEDTGALTHVEELIDRGTSEALTALGSVLMSDEGRTALTRLAELSVKRDR